MSPRRLYVPSILGALLTGGLAFLAAGRPWSHAVVRAKGVPTATVDVTGTDAVPVVTALALVIVAASLAMIPASTKVRRAVGVLMVASAVVAIVVIMTAGGALESGTAAAVHDSPAFIGTNGPDAVDHSVWRWVTVGAFVLAAGVGATVTFFGGKWPTMGSRYDAPKAHAKVDEPETDADIWKALDEGEDPTQ